MRLEYTFLCVFVFTFFKCSEETPQEGPQTNGSNDEVSTPSTQEGDGANVSRWNHARMRDFPTSTTLGYSEWWFLTTRRPFLSYRDFPGKPGVATWKEISPAGEKSKSQKTATPTAASVSSGVCSVFDRNSLLAALMTLLAMLVHRSLRKSSL